MGYSFGNTVCGSQVAYANSVYKAKGKSVVIPLETECSQYWLTSTGYDLVLFSFSPQASLDV